MVLFLVDYHTHPFSHGEECIKKQYSKEYIERFIQKAIKTGIKEIGFADHDEFIDYIDWDILKELKEKYKIVKLGIEFDFKNDKKHLNMIKKAVDFLPLDYSIGSVHYIDDWAFDHPKYIEKYKNRIIDDIYIEYFKLLKNAVELDIFQIVGHFDLIKIFGFKPDNISIMDLAKPVLQTIKENGMVIEVNTNGLNKPVNELYPEINIIKMANQFNIPITLGSDAHTPDRVGEGIKMAVRIIRDIGYKEIAIFNNKNIILKKI